MTSSTPGSFRHLLVATDLTDASREAVEAALRLAHALGARITVLHVTEPPFDPPRWWSVLHPDAGASIRDATAWESAAARLLGALVKERRDLDQAPSAEDTRILVVPAGVPSDAILEQVRLEGADLLVAGTHGRRGTRAALLGSVAAKLVLAAPCPVLTFRSASRAP